ncbi:protein of unknown function [Shewanella benthica]|uniref:Uncharacterized protein n=1 Tax=Shewanella benthica TaxID=43661 RepID=A0A330M009_9GAMM|nr:protein of unknown function [Shewanella benthica]
MTIDNPPTNETRSHLHSKGKEYHPPINTLRLNQLNYAQDYYVTARCHSGHGNFVRPCR